LVAVAGDDVTPRVLVRERIALENPTVSRFVYHLAADADPREAPALVETARAAAATAATEAIRNAAERLRADGHRVAAAAVLTGAATIPVDLSTILASHSLIHAAEGALYREALTAACEACSIAVVNLRERDVWKQASTLLGLDEAALRTKLDAVGRAAGRPWAADQKMAVAAAWIALNRGHQSALRWTPHRRFGRFAADA
jgi:hypothetical protein